MNTPPALAGGVFTALKLLVDEARITDKKSANGCYLLTGPANVMALPQLADALVGRMRVLTLYPLSAVEVCNGKATLIRSSPSLQLKGT